jgi:Tfp pilus assembly protein PilF
MPEAHSPWAEGVGRVGLLLVSVACLAGCAANPEPTVSTMLIRHGKPSISFDVPPDPSAAAPAHRDKSRERAAVASAVSQRGERAASITMETTDKALKQALTDVGRTPSSANHRRVAAEYVRVRILDQAYDHLTMALQIDPKDSEALAMRARIWRDWGFPGLGLADAYRAVYYAPRSASAANTLGTLLQARGEPSAARNQYRRAVELDQHAAYALSNLCYLSFVTGDQAAAVEECKDALREQPGLASARNNLALSYAASGRLADAELALQEDDNPSRAAFNAGVLYMSVGQYELAEEAFRTASDIRPDFLMALRREEQASTLAKAAKHASTIHD